MALNLRRYPLLEIRQREHYKQRFILRVEENIPLPLDGSKLHLFRESLLSLSDIELFMLTTEKRGLAYEFILKQDGKYPRIMTKGWYVLAFYGKRIRTAQIIYQDLNVRVVKGGNGNFYGLIARRGVKEGEMPDEEVMSNEAGT